MWHMHDGVLPPFNLVARNFLDQNCRNRWIGREGPQPFVICLNQQNTQI